MVSRTKISTLKRVGLIFVMLLVAVFAMACKEKEVPVTDVTLDETELALYVGEYAILEATVAPENATDKTVTWTTSDDKVATVKNGVVEAKAAGEATITAKSGDKEATATVTVTERTEEYTVTFDSKGGSPVAAKTVLEGEKVQEPAEPTKDGFVFAGWYVNEKEFNFSSPITKDLELYAKWLEVFEVTFESNGGSDVEATTALEGERVYRPQDPKRVGYTFAGWYVDAALETPYDFLLPASKNLTLYAKWEIITYTVSIPSIGEVQTINHGDLAEEPELEVKDGFKFGGWYADAGFTEEFDFETPITENYTLYVKWDFDPEVYTEVEFEVGGGEWSLSAVQMFFAGIDEVSSHTINYFNADNTQYLAVYPTTVFLGDKNSPKKALAWVRIIGINRTPNGLYEIAEVHAASGTSVDGGTYDYFLYAHDGNPAGYAFLGTLQKGQLVTLEGFDVVSGKPGPMEATLRVYAEGTPVDTSVCAVRVNSPLPTPTKAGFTFGGWYDNEDFDGEPVTSVSEKTTLYAKWIITYEVSFGEDSKTQIIPENGKATVPAIPTKTGKYFRGWYVDEEFTELFNFDTPITEDITLYAKWDDNIVIETDNVDYEAVWNEARGTYYIKITVPEEDLDKDSVKSIKVLEEAGERLETPRELTPDTDKVMWFGVSKIDSDVSFKKAGNYSYEVVREDDSVYVFTFNYNPTKVEGLIEVVYAETNYEAVLNADREMYYIEVVAPGEDLDAASISAISTIKVAGELLEEAKALTPDTDKVMWFGVAEEEEKDLEYKEAGEYAYRVTRKDGSEFILKFNYNPNMVVGVVGELAEVDYEAVWNGARGTYYIKVSASKDLDAANVKAIHVLAEAGVELETPRALTPDTDKVLWFGVAKGDANLGFKAEGRYAYEVTLKDDTKHVFEFYYRPELVRNLVYLVNFDANGGKLLDQDNVSTFVLHGDKVAEPNRPTRDGYKFLGWYLNDKLFDFDNEVIGHINLVAKWELEIHKINYELNGGKFPYTEFSQETKDAMKVEFLTDFYNWIKANDEDFEEDLDTFMHGEGKTEGFDGTWHATHKEKLYDGTRPNGPNDELGLFIAASEYYHKWLPFFDNIQRFVKAVNSGQNFYGDTFVGFIRIRDYMIELEARGVHLQLMPQVPAEFDYFVETILPIPVKEGHKFEGWYLKADFSGDPVDRVTAGTTGDVTVYAKWSEVTE
jgi:uncharacterized repeat protein (TIGR02543 family)